MPPKELGRHQLSSRLQFQSQTPSFLKAFKAKVSGGRVDDDDEGPQYANGDEYGLDDGEELDEFGRAKRREEPMVDEFGREIRRDVEDDRGKKGGRHGADSEEDEDEKPTVVVLKEGKHLTERQAENERRKARGLSPLPELEDPKDDSKAGSSTKAKATSSSTSKNQGTTPGSAKSSVQIGGKLGGATKRKAPIGSRVDEQDSDNDAAAPAKKKVKTGDGKAKAKGDSKKPKKAVKGLLSFGDDG
ncbi:hypothetical protein CPB86DRAFT_741175 [Serendipita vermifera]|nr:hypothetical protein CPB86DRAFT_741175 [Serendipita vermifera]